MFKIKTKNLPYDFLLIKCSINLMLFEIKVTDTDGIIHKFLLPVRHNLNITLLISYLCNMKIIIFISGNHA